MRLFRGRFRFDKKTDEKFRWILDVNGVQFKVYITQDRVPEYPPALIEVTVLAPPKNDDWYSYKLTKLGSKTVDQLTLQEKQALERIGLTEEDLKRAGSDAIFGAVKRAAEGKDQHTETIRYDTFRASKESEFGDPYVPRSVFQGSYPDRLIFLVQWIS